MDKEETNLPLPLDVPVEVGSELELGKKKNDLDAEREFEVLKTYTDKIFLIAGHEELLGNLTKDKDQQNFSFQPGLPNAYPVNIVARNRVSIAQLSGHIDKIWEGKFLLCRTITIPIRMTSLMTIVEDPEPNSLGVYLALYNFEPPMEGWGKDPAEILPPGTILAIKNPLFRRSADEGYIVRCDSPMDVVEIDEATFNKRFHRLQWPSGTLNKEIILKAKCTDHKSIAQYNLQRNNYNKAIQAFSAAIKSNPGDIDALVQRAAVYLKLMVYKKCLDDSATVLCKDPYHEAAVLQKICSLIGINDFISAIQFIKWQIQHGKARNSPRIKLQLKQVWEKAKLNYSQYLTGKYDMLDFIRKPNSFVHDCADYYGAVDIVPIAGKGRGVIATEFINAGDLVLAHKAFGFSVPGKDVCPIQHWVLDTKSQVLKTITQARIASCIAHRLMQEPELGEELYQLYAGPDSEDIHDYNVLDMKRVAQIYAYNGFMGNKKDDEEGACGLWLYISYINHSCYDANCNWTMYGNMLFVRARKDIEKGEEITIPYITADEPYCKRLQQQQKFGFICDCTLCAFESKEDTAVHKRRQDLMTEFYNLENSRDPDLNEMERCIAELQQLRPKNPELNLFLVYPMMLLARKYDYNLQVPKACKILHSAHSIAFKTVMTDYALQCAIHGTRCYLKTQDFDKARQSLSTLKFNMILAHGTASESLLQFLDEGLVKMMSIFNFKF